MLLCESLAAILASRSNRLMNSLFWARASSRTLTATIRSTLVLPRLVDDPHRPLAELLEDLVAGDLELAARLAHLLEDADRLVLGQDLGLDHDLEQALRRVGARELGLVGLAAPRSPAAWPARGGGSTSRGSTRSGSRSPSTSFAGGLLSVDVAMKPSLGCSGERGADSDGSSDSVRGGSDRATAGGPDRLAMDVTEFREARRLVDEKFAERGPAHPDGCQRPMTGPGAACDPPESGSRPRLVRRGDAGLSRGLRDAGSPVGRGYSRPRTGTVTRPRPASVTLRRGRRPGFRRRRSVLPTIGVIAGDGVGPEVVREALAVLDDVAGAEGFAYETVPFDLGGERYLKTGEVLPDAGARGPPAVRRDPASAPSGIPASPPGVLEKGLLLRLRFDFHQYINLRPVRLYPGVETPIKGKGPGRHRPGRRPREQRGPLRRRRRLHPQGDARGGRDPDLDQHPGRRRALPAVRLRPGPRRGAGRGPSAASAPTTSRRGKSGWSRWSPRPTS